MHARDPLPPFPRGWFQVAYSDDLAAGAVQPLAYFGRPLVLYRGDDGRAAVLDALCTHLGANIALGGRVEGNTLVCPCHGWRYDASGACVQPAGAPAIPGRARVQAWIVAERNGLIMVWHHVEAKEPEWAIPELAEYASAAWTSYDKRRWPIRVHVQQVAENAIERELAFAPGPSASVALQVDGPRLRAVARARLQTSQGVVDVARDTRLWGFGFVTVRFSGGADGLLVGSATPVDAESVDVRYAFSVRKLRNAAETVGAGAAIIADVERRMSEDKVLWENGSSKDEPTPVSEDDPIAIFRRWSEQFYD